MADDFAITAGAGITIAADEVGGVKYQRTKAVWGVDGTVVDTSATNPLPVTLSNIEKAEDTAHTTADKGIMALAVVTTDGDGTSATDGDYAALTLGSAGALRVQDVPHTAGGLSISRLTDIDETEDTVKASAGMVYGLTLWNTSTTAAHFVHFYDAAAPDTATDTPLASFCIAAANAADEPRVLALTFEKGIPFATAITVGALTTMAPGAGAPGASEVQGTILYK